MSVFYILIVAAGIGFLILAHEFGHFMVAKKTGVKVENFSIGFGPEIFGFALGETRYSLRIVPLGGYVKMLGDEPASEEAADERSFLKQGFAKKFLIVAAGSVANMILSLLLFIAAFRIGVAFPAARVGHVTYGSTAYFAGLENGDRILRVDGRGDVDFYEFATTVALADAGRPVRVLIGRGEAEFEKELYPQFNPQLGRHEAGIQPYSTLTIDGFVEILANRGTAEEPEYERIPNPSETAGVSRGWTIRAFNEEPVETWSGFERMIAANGLEPYRLTFARYDSKTGEEAEHKTLDIKPVRSPLPLLGINPTVTTRVVGVEESSLAAEMGLAAGDEILGLGEVRVGDYFELRAKMAQVLPDPPPLIISRDGKRLELPWPGALSSEAVFLEGLTTEMPPVVPRVVAGTAAEVMGIQPGDVIVAVDGREVTNFEDVRNLLAESKGDTITVRWLRGDEEREGTFQPVAIDIIPQPEQIMRKLGFGPACTVGVRKAWDFAAQVYLIIRKVLSGQAGIAKNVGGPVTIARASYHYARHSLASFIFFLAVISVNLCIFNLLPIPILDGGLLALLVLEKAKGSPFSPRAQAAFQYAGLAVIVALFIFITYQDIARIFQ